MSSDNRIEFARPVEYRLASRNGFIMLQGAFFWKEGDAQGVEWRDLPTVEVEEPANA